MALYEVTWCMVVWCTQNLRRDCSSFIWHQPYQCLKYTTSVNIQKTRYKKLVIHVESHARAVSARERRIVLYKSSHHHHHSHMLNAAGGALLPVKCCVDCFMWYVPRSLLSELCWLFQEVRTPLPVKCCVDCFTWYVPHSLLSVVLTVSGGTYPTPTCVECGRWCSTPWLWNFSGCSLLWVNLCWAPFCLSPCSLCWQPI